MKARIGWLLAGALASLASAGAEQLPLKTYTTADGLRSDRAPRVLFDAQGFLWLGTEDGLSRFDGYGFRNFGTADGLPPSPIQAMRASRTGVLWIGTNAGVVRLDPTREPGAATGFARVLHLPGGGHHDEVVSLLEDRSGALWAGTVDGLFRSPGAAADPAFRRVAVAEAPETTEPINALFEDGDGTLWIGSELGLYRRSTDGRVERVPGSGGAPRDVQCLTRDRRGSLWIGTRLEGLFEMPPSSSQPRPAFSVRTGLAGQHVTSLLETPDGTLWATCFGGLSEIAPDRSAIRRYTPAEGLSGVGLWSLAEDRDGDLWIGSDSGGVMRLAREGFRGFNERDGLRSLRVAALFENREGSVCAFTRGQKPEDIAGGDGFVECFDGRRFGAHALRLPPGTLYGWGWSQFMLQDEAGDWWVPTLSGLFRFSPVPFERLGDVAPARRYGTRDGIPRDGLLRLYEDRRGDLWMSAPGQGGNLARWDRHADSIRVFRAADGFPDREPMAFAEDRDGNLWIGIRGGGLVRYRDGRMALCESGSGFPKGSIRALHVDRSGHLWIASSGSGLARVDRPDQWPPRFVPIGTPQGLSSDNVSSLTEDRWGRIYAGTERGLDRIDPVTGNVQRYTADDGLPHGVIEASLCDRSGDLWFGSVEGLSRLRPRLESRRAPLAARIARVLVNGVRQSVGELGAPSVVLHGRVAQPASVQIDFLSLDFAPGGSPRYQYRVDGLDRDWSPPTDQRSVVYARLPAGAFRFRVRAVSNDGTVGPSGAEVRFAVTPPFWRRPETIAAALVGLAAAAFLFHRLRLRRVLEIERLRTRVATDLHDDIGSGLSEIAILSELAGGKDVPNRAPVLAEIGDRARNLVDSMSDIVWSTDPRRDDVASLAQRIRRFAANTLEGRGIAWSLALTDPAETRPLDAERRRQVLLIVKEALTNVARHSGAARARVTIAPEGDTLLIEIEDDGRGFDASPGNSFQGIGIASMRARASSVQGALHIESRRPGGTRITARIPLGRTSSGAA